MVESVNYRARINTLPNNQNQVITRPVGFRADTLQPLEREPKTDTVEITKTSDEKKGLSKAAKWGLGIAGTIAAAAFAGICIMKGKANKIANLYKEKLIKSNLPEKIEFEEAKTIDEGIKFAKEVLGIKEVKGFKEFNETGALEAINFANKGIVDVANANKGNIFIPRVLSFESIEGSTTAYANLAIESSKFGQLGINRNYFTHDGLDAILKKRFNMVSEVEAVTPKATENTAKRKINLGISWSERYKDLVSRYKADPSKLTIPEKRELEGIYQATANVWNNLTHYNPLTVLQKNTELFKQSGIVYDLEALAKLSVEEQCAKFDEICSQFVQKTNKLPVINSSEYTPCETIYHEMGHLQDYAKNLKELHAKDTQWGMLKEQLFHNKKPEESVCHINNRWAKRDDSNFKQLLKDKPEEFKKRLPDLYEHLTNPEVQKTAGKVSSYAREGVGEFIADTYAGLISGRKYSDDVISLYKKYNGPLLPEM